MQSTTLQFRQRAAGYVRPISWGVRASFEKAIDPTITYFTLDVSVLDGTDILAPTGDNPVQLWDQYIYNDYTDKVISIEVTREEVEPYSVAKAYADITVNNYDGYFTPQGGSPIEDYIIPRRPFRALMGFGNERLHQIVGLSEGMPKIDKSDRTASFHVIDFMSYLFDQDIGESIILEDLKTHEILDYLFGYLGLNDTQYVLDDSLNRIKFFYVEKGTKFGTVASKLMEAEIGRLYLDEEGLIRFNNRYNYNTTPVINLDKSNVINYSVEDGLIINKVKIQSKVREVQPLQSVWTGSISGVITPGATKELFVDFSDPITTIIDPTYSATETNTSYFSSHLNSDKTGVYTDIDLVSLDLFSKSAKLVFENTGVSDGYVTEIDLYGTPAKIVDTVSIEEIDQGSIDNFEEQLYEIDNEYIQDESNAQSRALLLIHDYKDYGSVVSLDIKGSPALQLGDAVDLDVDGYQGTHIIIKTTNIMSDGRFIQRVKVRNKAIVTFFTLDVSILDGNDLLGV